MRPLLLDQPEQRFPLELGPVLPRIRDLFQAATRNQWDPVTDIPWDELRPERYSDAEREAGRFFWSRRAWGEYGAVSESPAILIRFCHEKREPDLRYFFTLRTQEESRHAEASWMMAEKLGGYIAEPAKREFQQAVATHGVRSMALDPDTSLEGIIAGLVCVLEEYGFDWFKLMGETAANPAVLEMLRLITRDEARHCAFGWLYLEERVPRLSEAQREAVRDATIAAVERVEMTGYRVPWLAPDSAAVLAESDSDRRCFAAGLGATTEEIEKPVFVRTTERIRERMRQWGIELPMFRHPRIGAF